MMLFCWALKTHFTFDLVWQDTNISAYFNSTNVEIYMYSSPWLFGVWGAQKLVSKAQWCYWCHRDEIHLSSICLLKGQCSSPGVGLNPFHHIPVPNLLQIPKSSLAQQNFLRCVVQFRFLMNAMCWHEVQFYRGWKLLSCTVHFLLLMWQSANCCMSHVCSIIPLPFLTSPLLSRALHCWKVAFPDCFSVRFFKECQNIWTD